MKTALIGATGFIGSNLSRLHAFTDFYDSKTIGESRGRSYDLVVCAAPHAKKWWANQNPDEDLRLCEGLVAALEEVRADRFVLLSTVDVFPRVAGVDESFDCHGEPNHAYGRNRLAVEDAVRRTFPRHHVLRLPGLFGPGLRKNVLYDLLHDNLLEKIEPRSSFQWFDVELTWRYVERVVEEDLPLVMLATEPVATRDVLARYFPAKSVGSDPGPEVHYDLRTRYAERLGGAGGYLMSAEQVLERVGRFVRASRGEAP